jgi:hypothetical protein
MAVETGITGQEDASAFVVALHRHRHGAPHQHSVLADPTRPPVSSSGSSYKQLKEDWIANQTGSSIHRVNLLGISMLLTYALWAAVRAKRLKFVISSESRSAHEPLHSGVSNIYHILERLSDWQFEFILLVVPGCLRPYDPIISSHYVQLGSLRCMRRPSLVSAVQASSPPGPFSICQQAQASLG